MNTLIYLWLEPVSRKHKATSERLYFELIIQGELKPYKEHDDRESYLEYIEDLLDRDCFIRDIMDFAEIDANGNYGVLSHVLTSQEAQIRYAKSPEEIKQETNREIVLSRPESFSLTKKNVTIEDDSCDIKIDVPAMGVAQTLDFRKLWARLEKNIIGRIQEGQRVELKNEAGDMLFELIGGSFLEIRMSDLKVFHQGRIIGGAYIRDDGSIDIGDADRTFYMKIETKNLLLTSLRLNKSINNMTNDILFAPDNITEQSKP